MADSANKSDEPLASLSDLDLVEFAQKGSSSAFELIVRRHNRTLFRAARGVLNDDGLAQEAVQEAYLKAFTSLDSFQARSSLKTWLTRIVVNQAIDFSRRSRPAVPLEENIAYLHDRSSEGGNMAGRIVDHSNPETEAARQETRLLLEDAIRRLPAIYRCVFILRDVEGLSTADSAFCLNINEALVKKRLSRAREMLRQDLLKRLETEVSGIFDFAGKRCDTLTAHVMAELVRRGMIKQC
ncbi:RNA polymerase sigma factor [Aquamicrobium sp.]|uniref:RNA polymerase sigma factor n=1 Tax=Aquamicrobium sp. TaxID=1872579 RepID=UPI00258AF0DD|nr:RNA polymerase sigma factor [Aquamicrobium sp.]MCK9554161.1 RNA polymerase sigma factor [Aquamicrobium sp.]